MSTTNKPTRNLTAEGREIIHTILEIALTTPKETADVFVDWSPHCDSLDIRVFAFGWSKGADSTLDLGCYFSHGHAEADLTKAKDRLEKYLLELNSPEAAKAARSKKAAELRVAAERLAAEAAALEGGAS